MSGQARIEAVAKPIARLIAKSDNGAHYEGFESSHWEAAQKYARAAIAADPAIAEMVAILLDATDPRGVGLAGDTHYFRDTEFSRRTLKRMRDFLAKHGS